MRSSRIVTNRKFPTALARKRAFGGAGDTRYASSTWLRSSRAQVWFSATTAAKRNATQISPPAISRDSSAVGLKAKLKITTTSSAKNSMELMASLERHSMRRSLRSVERVMVKVLMRQLPQNLGAPFQPSFGWGGAGTLLELPHPGQPTARMGHPWFERSLS